MQLLGYAVQKRLNGSMSGLRRRRLECVSLCVLDVICVVWICAVSCVFVNYCERMRPGDRNLQLGELYTDDFRLHWMREMLTIVANVCGVCPSVCLATQLHCAKTAERIYGLFVVNTRGNIVVDGGPDPPQRGDLDSMQPLPNYFGLLFGWSWIQ